ncbi:DUF4350 domain-containing protein [Thermogladius sp. 4427co]|uniref:DUF4350 domain-containing protein n=1 Tax=Thermogladius sp. 4427co TaxID=3450718 RepID=UPI003F7A2A78
MRYEYLVISSSIILASLVALSVIVLTPSPEPYSIANNGPEGLSTLYNTFRPVIVLDYSKLSSVEQSKTVLILVPDHDISPRELSYISDFIGKGGLVITSLGPASIRLLEYLNVSIEYSNHLLLDEVSKLNNRFEPVVFYTTLNLSIVLKDAHPLTTWGSSGECVVYSSPFSYIDLNDNGYYDLNETVDSFCVGVRIRYLNGTILFLASSNPFVNELFDYNRDFIIHGITSDRSILLIDQTLAGKNPVEYLRIQLVRESSIVLTLLVVTLMVIGVAIVGKNR